MRRGAQLLALSLAVACAAPAPRPAARPVAAGDPIAYLRSTLVPWPDATATNRIAVTDPIVHRVAVYDSALVVLVLIRRGARAEAAAVLGSLAALQREDGSLPFSFVLPRPDDGTPYVRTGAVAWVGYAAAEYLDADRAGPFRAEALTLARRAAAYVMAQQVAGPGDPRDGLVRGGAGTLRYEVDDRGALRERLEREDIAWAAVEHNIDAFFFLRALARVTGDHAYADAALRIARGLSRAWDGARGLLVRGLGTAGPDDVMTLDCASWGSVFLGAAGDRDRAATAAAVADSGFAARDPRTGARGHRAQARGPILESAVLMRVLGPTLPAPDWADLQAVWPEGSAGVALAAARLGRVDRARTILAELEILRAPDGSLPTSTVAIPFVFDTRPSIAGTAWVELVRFELDRPRPTLWVPW